MIRDSFSTVRKVRRFPFYVIAPAVVEQTIECAVVLRLFPNGSGYGIHIVLITAVLKVCGYSGRCLSAGYRVSQDTPCVILF